MLFHVLSSLILGLLSGYIACQIMHQRSGMVLNLIIGVVGAGIGNFLFGLFGLTSYSWLGDLLVSIVGACVLLWLVNYLMSRR